MTTLDDPIGYRVQITGEAVLKLIQRFSGGSSLPVVFTLGDIMRETGCHTRNQLRHDLEILELGGVIGRVVISRRNTAYYDPKHFTRSEALLWLKMQAPMRRLGDSILKLNRKQEREAA